MRIRLSIGFIQKSVFFLMFIILNDTTYAQLPQVDSNLKQEMIQKKAIRYQQLMLCENEKTANQENYDVKYYALDLTPDPATSILSGSVEIVAEVSASTLDQVELNFWEGMSITSLYKPNSPDVQLNHNRSNDILSVNLDRTFTQGEQFRITIEYNGRPQDSDYSGFDFDTYDGKTMIWTFSQPWGARSWWPCKDVPSDKADSVDIRITVPNDLIVASNGSLRETITEGNNIQYWWHEKYPIATYLVFLAIYPYEVYYDDYLYNNNTDTMKIHFFTFPGNYEKYYSINTKVKDMITCFANLFGEYPFIDEKYGHADFSFPYGAIEHQTCSSYAICTEYLYAHELAHQWWGDMITYFDWYNTWIGEGFAVYSEALWYEYQNGPGTASIYQMCENLYYGPGTVYIEDLETESPFDMNLAYKKGSWILHMLRHVVEDNTFFEILKTYHYSTKHQYGTATIEEFQVICEQISGINLDKFFHQWFHEEYYPKYSFSWSFIQTGSNYDIQLQIFQEQTNHIFWMPIDISITTVNGDTTLTVLDSLQAQSFQFSISSEPINLELDKNNWILKKVQDPIVNPTFDQGILLVNGVSFDVYGSEIWNAYEDSAFWGDFPITFWDCFITSQNGYPLTLPEQFGCSRVPASLLGQFSTIIWIGNNYAGDLESWSNTSILEYLQAGGNVILITRKGQDFIDDDLKQYLGISWVENPDNTINNCISAYTGLQDMTLIGDQTLNAVFDTTMSGTENTLLFKETVSFSLPRGLGIWHKPIVGGTYRNDGGQFVFVSGRPYRYNSSQLRSNIELMLENFFNESKSTNINSTCYSPFQYHLDQNYPNPFNPKTVIRYALPIISQVNLSIYNLLGQKLITLVSEKQQAGTYKVEWNASVFSSGIYFYRLETSTGFVQSKKLVLLK